MPYDELPDLAGLSLAQIAELAAARKLPPVEGWNPQATSDSHMRIAADGSWFHDDAPILRPAMVRAFLSILRREADGSYWLVTPHYKQSIIVEDVPFLATDFEARGHGKDQDLAFRLNDDSIVIASADHPLRFVNMNDEPRPYVAARGGMEARLTRSAFYRLVEIAEDDQHGGLGLWSGGVFFSLVDDRGEK